MTKLFHTYMTFTIDSSKFSFVFFQEIVICKNNGICTVLNSNFDILIFSTKVQSGKANDIFTIENIEKDDLVPSIYK